MQVSNAESLLSCGCIVEPPKRGHFGTVAFVLSSEVVLFSEVVYYLPCIPPYYNLDVFKVTSYYSISKVKFVHNE